MGFPLILTGVSVLVGTDGLNKIPVTRRDQYLQRTYGITEQQYNSLLKKQSDCCAVCGKHKSKERTNLHVDHDHKTSEIRGLLCNFCNRRIIGRHRDGLVFSAAAKYLSGPFTGWIVPKKKPKKRKRRKH